MIEDVEVTCPACWETIELTVDLSGGSAVYTEDCPVCCQPMTVRLTVESYDPDEPSEFRVEVEAESG